MRQIKFRAYSTVTGCFDYFDMTEILTSDNSRISKKMLNDDISIEQFTGLTDKNGVDRCEGDIVKVGNYITKIIYRDNGFYLERNQTIVFDDAALKLSTVIGNIHETPELLPK